MSIEFIRNKDNNIKNKIVDMLSKNSLSKIIVLGTVDNHAFKLFNTNEIVSNYTQYISVDKKYTTYKMLEDLIENGNTYIYNNNLHKETRKENIIFCVYDDEIEMLMSSFEFTQENLENSSSVSIYVRGKMSLEEMKEVVSLYNYYKDNVAGYLKLDSDVLNKFDKNKDLRNSKMETIFEEMQMDEVISSFRNKEKAYKNIYDKKNSLPVTEEIDIEINID